MLPRSYFGFPTAVPPPFSPYGFQPGRLPCLVAPPKDSITESSVWEKGEPISGLNPSQFRRDSYGRTMRWEDHGDKNSHFGWEIDHIVPRADGGRHELANVQPLHWRSHMGKTTTENRLRHMKRLLIGYPYPVSSS